MVQHITHCKVGTLTAVLQYRYTALTKQFVNTQPWTPWNLLAIYWVTDATDINNQYATRLEPTLFGQSPLSTR